ncbi:MAG: hypothetical protein J6Z18_02235 [Prevotella sp.]|nr:hypothetical protein [Prevotella sp.]
MKTNRIFWMSTAILFCGVSMLFCGCESTKAGYPLVAGTLDGALPADSAPAKVLEAINGASRFHQHDILNDTVNDVAVFSLDEVDDTATEGYGIVVVKGSTSTTFPNIRHTRQPLARYDQATGDLWLTSSAMEGTGIQVEWLYLLRFHDDNTAYVSATVNPYDVQQALCQRLGYAIHDQEITLYDGKRSIGTATNTLSDMGGFDADQPLWIGEQLCYDISGEVPALLITPGVKYTTGLVLTYGDMPMVTGSLTVDEKGQITIGELETIIRPFEGSFLDQDNHEPNLLISYRRNDGKYDVQIGIFRLTTLDDGIGTMEDEGLDFTATDAAGNPISGVITLHGDTALVTFTRSTWGLLENGSEFVYTRKGS